MAKNIAAGLLMFRRLENVCEYFLVHPGGPFFRNKDAGVWTIPKGIPEGNEELLATAIREFKEETNIESKPPYIMLDPVKQKSGKVIYAWGFEGQWDSTTPIISNTFELEWPPKSKMTQLFPEIDGAQWFTLTEAKEKIIPAQFGLVEQLQTKLR